MARFALLILAVILYGSLFPFDLRPAGGIGDAVQHFLHAWPARSSLPDLAANVLLFMPFGITVCAAAAKRIGRLAAIALALGCGVAVATAIELTQHFIPQRVVNPVDVICNAIGTLLGALAGALLGGTSAPVWRRGPAIGDRMAVLLAGAWIVDRLWPFVPTLDVQQVKDALKPLLLRPQLDPADVLRHAASWFGFALLLRAGVPRLATRLGVLAAIAALPFAALFIQGRTLSASAALGAALAGLLWLALAQRPERTGARVLAVLMSAAVLAVGLAPYSFTAPPRSFAWIPFAGFVGGTQLAALAAFLTKTYLFGTLVWALARSGAGIVVAGSATALLMAAIGLAQTYLPGRSGSITDAVIAICLAFAIHWLREPMPAAAGTGRAASAARP